MLVASLTFIFFFSQKYDKFFDNVPLSYRTKLIFGTEMVMNFDCLFPSPALHEQSVAAYLHLILVENFGNGTKTCSTWRRIERVENQLHEHQRSLLAREGIRIPTYSVSFLLTRLLDVGMRMDFARARKGLQMSNNSLKGKSRLVNQAI